MADGVAITAGSGTTIATDDCGASGHAQVVKLAYSADGTATLIGADANGLDVDVTRLPALAAGTNNIGDVDVLTVNGVAPAFGTGARGSTVQRVTIATDDVLAVTDNGGTLSVDDGSGALTVDNDGTFAVQAAQSGTWTVQPGNTANTTAWKVDASSVAVPVTDNSGSLTVDNAGTFAVQAAQSGTWTVQPGNTANTTAWKVDASSVAVPVTDNSGSLTVDNSGTFAVQAASAGDVAHDGADSGNPLKLGAVAIAHGTNPTAVAAADRTNLYANRAGVLWTIGGHPNAVSATYITTAAQTDDNVMAAVSSGTKYAVTRITVFLDEATTVGTAVRLGFGTSTIPALGASAADAVADILCYHPGLVPGSGFTIGDGSGVLGVGGDGAELRITCEAPTTGTLAVSVTYFTIES